MVDRPVDLFERQTARCASRWRVHAVCVRVRGSKHRTHMCVCMVVVVVGGGIADVIAVWLRDKRAARPRLNCLWVVCAVLHLWVASHVVLLSGVRHERIGATQRGLRGLWCSNDNASAWHR